MRQGHAYNPASTAEPKPLGTIARVHARHLTVPDFVARFEAPNLPVVLAGIADAWPAYNGAWEPRNLYARYRHRRFRCGEASV